MGGALSKTEALYSPPPRVEYSLADTSRFNALDVNGSAAGFIDYTQEFKYLSSIIHCSLNSEADVKFNVDRRTLSRRPWPLVRLMNNFISLPKH